MNLNATFVGEDEREELCFCGDILQFFTSTNFLFPLLQRQTTLSMTLSGTKKVQSV